MADRKSFLLRVDAELYEALRSWADQEMRSVNSQIEYLLRQAVASRKGPRSSGGTDSSKCPEPKKR